MTSMIYLLPIRTIIHRYVWTSHLIYLSVHELLHCIPHGESTCESEFNIHDVRERIPYYIPPIVSSVKRYDAGGTV